MAGRMQFTSDETVKPYPARAAIINLEKTVMGFLTTISGQPLVVYLIQIRAPPALPCFYHTKTADQPWIAPRRSPLQKNNPNLAVINDKNPQTPSFCRLCNQLGGHLLMKRTKNRSCVFVAGCANLDLPIFPFHSSAEQWRIEWQGGVRLPFI